MSRTARPGCAARCRRAWPALLAVAPLGAPGAVGRPRRHGHATVRRRSTPRQRADAADGIARDTWTFFDNGRRPDDPPAAGQPRARAPRRGAYTSAANIGVYLWSVVSAADLGLITRAEATQLITADADVGRAASSARTASCTSGTTPSTGARDPQPRRCRLRHRDDAGAGQLLLPLGRRQRLVRLRTGRRSAGAARAATGWPTASSSRWTSRSSTTTAPQTACNTNAAIDGNQPTGQQYGGYYVDQGPAGYHNGALYSDPRISMYIGHGPAPDARRRLVAHLARPLPPQQCTTDPDFSWQGQWPPQGYWMTDHAIPSRARLSAVWEGHYTYPGTSLTFLPTFGGGMFEGLMANEVVPETTWGPHGFGLADVRTAQVQIKYATAAAAATRSGACHRRAPPTTPAATAPSASRA